MKRIISAVLILGLFLCFSSSVNSGAVFPAGEVGNVDVEKYKVEIFRIVGEKLGFELDSNIPLPSVIVEMPLDEFNAELYMAGLLSTIGTYFEYTWPMYLPERNVINLTRTSWLDVLAHEATHYFQHKYRENLTTKGDGATPMWFEEEAYEVQYWFRDKYLPEYWDQKPG